MSPREDIDDLTKPFAHRLSAMVDAGFLTYREYVPWADALILRMNLPPAWILDLALTAHRDTAVQILMKFTNAEPFHESSSYEAWTDEYVAALYLRYERRELSWASILEMAGRK